MEAQRRQVISQSSPAFHKASPLMTNCHKQTWWTIYLSALMEGTTGRVHPTVDNLNAISWVGNPPETVSISLPGSVWLTWTWTGKFMFMVQVGA